MSTYCPHGHRPSADVLIDAVTAALLVGGAGTAFVSYLTLGLRR